MTTGLLATVGDPASTRTVYAIVVGLALIGVVLAGLGVWLIRRTRVDPELLGPLERMEDRRWRKLDPVRRRRLLDEVRPEGAQPVTPVPPDPEVDREFERSRPPVASFDDLEALGGATTRVDGTRTRADDVGSSADDVGSSADDVGSATDDVGSSADDVGSATDDVGSSADDVGSSADGVGSSADDIGSSADVVPAGDDSGPGAGDDVARGGDGSTADAGDLADEPATVGERVGEPVASDDDR